MSDEKSEWIESVVREWVIALKQAGFSKEECMRAQHYLDMEYPEKFEYPEAYKALRSFFMLAEMMPGQEKDDHILDSSAARILCCAEAAYRMGYDDAMKKAGKPQNESEATGS